MKKALLLSALVMAWLSPPADAQQSPLHQPNPPIFDNFGPGHTFLCCWGGNVSGVSTTSPEMEAVAFTPAANGTAHHIMAALGWISGDNAAVFSLYTDNSGLPGTDIVDGVILGGLPTFATSNATAATASIPATPLLGGTQYWLVVWVDTSNTVAAWSYSPHYHNPPGLTANCAGNPCTWAPYAAIPANQAFAFKVW